MNMFKSISTLSTRGEQNKDDDRPKIIVSAKDLSRSRAELEDTVRKNPKAADAITLYALGRVLVQDGLDNKPNRVQCLQSGLLLIETSIKRDIQLSDSDLKLMAKGYSDLWLGLGVAAQDYLLQRAKEFYQNLMELGEVQDAATLLGYCRVLQYTNCNEEAAGVINSLLSFTDGEPEYPNYLLYAGDIYKQLGNYEQAATYFFEATQLGPPRLFSKLEMMFIISRNIEEGAKDKDESCDDAYEMVYTHMVMEGRVPETVSYDDWINDSQTWMDLGHKCSVHGAHALARDLYGQALLRDPLSYRKTKIWYMFSKSCNLCGLSSDAQLSIRQSLTVEPHNSQLQRALKSWAEAATTFKDSVDAANIEEIVASVPPEADFKQFAIKKIQGLFRGAHERKSIAAGQLKQAMHADDGSTARVKGSNIRKMAAHIGTLFECDAVTTLNGTHPVILSARADWAGRIRYITAFDVRSGRQGKLPLPSAVFAPALEHGVVRKFKLTISCREKFEKIEKAPEPLDLFNEHYFSKSQAAETNASLPFSRPVSRGTVDSSVRAMAPKGGCDGLESLDQELVGYKILVLQFTDVESGQYIAKQFVLAAMDKAGTLYRPSRPATSLSLDKTVRQVGEVLRSGPVSPRPQSPQLLGGILNSSIIPPPAGAETTMLDALSLADVSGCCGVFTSIPKCQISVGGIRWSESLCSYRFYSNMVHSYLAVYQISSGLSLLMTMQRLHVDRTHNMKRKINQLLSVLSQNGPITHLFKEGQTENNSDWSSFVESGTVHRQVVRVKDHLLLLHIRPAKNINTSKYAVIVELFDPSLDSVLETPIAILDRRVLPQPGAISPRAFAPIDVSTEPEKVVEEIAPEPTEELAIEKEESVLEAEPIVDEPEPEIKDAPVEIETEAITVEEDVQPVEIIQPEIVSPPEVANEQPSVERIYSGSRAPSPAALIMATSTVALVTQVAQLRIASRPNTPGVLPPVAQEPKPVEACPESTPPEIEVIPPADVVREEPAAPEQESDAAVAAEIETAAVPEQESDIALQAEIETAVAPDLSPEVVEPINEPSIEESASVEGQPAPHEPVEDGEAQSAEENDKYNVPEPLATEPTQPIDPKLVLDLKPAEAKLESSLDEGSPQVTSTRLVDQIQARKQSSAMKTYNFLEHERRRLEACDFLYSVAQQALAKAMREEALNYLLQRVAEAVAQVRTEEEAAALAKKLAEEAELAKERAGVTTPSRKSSSPAPKLKKSSSERFMSMKKQTSNRSLKDGETTKVKSNRGLRLNGLAELGESSSALVEVSTPVDTAKEPPEDDPITERPLQSRDRDLNSLADTASSYHGTVSTYSKGEPRYMNSILDAMKSKDLKANRTERGHDYTMKQQLLLRQPLDVDALPDYAFDSAQGLVLALQEQDRQYDAFLQRKTVKEMQRLEHMQAVQQQQIALAIQKEKDLAALRREKKGTESTVGSFGPALPSRGRKKKSPTRTEYSKGYMMSSETLRNISVVNEAEGSVSPNRKLAKSTSVNSLGGGLSIATFDGPRYRSSSWGTDGEGSIDLLNDHDDGDLVLPPLPVNADYMNTLFAEQDAIRLSPSKARSAMSRSTPAPSGAKSGQGQLMSRTQTNIAKGQKGGAQPSKSAILIAEGRDPMAFLSLKEGGDKAKVPGDELCRTLMDTFRFQGYVPPNLDGNKFSNQWHQRIHDLVTAMPDIRWVKKSVATLQKSHPAKISRLAAFCALASTGGRVPDALGKLGDKEFGMEVNLACKIVPVKAIVAEVEGLGEYLFDKREGTNSPRRKRSRSPNRGRALSPTSPPLSPGHPENQAGLVTECDDFIRVKGLAATKKLPHLNMLQTSHAVRTRSTEIHIVRDRTSSAGSDSVPGFFPSISQPLSADANSKMFVGDEEEFLSRPPTEELYAVNGSSELQVSVTFDIGMMQPPSRSGSAAKSNPRTPKKPLGPAKVEQLVEDSDNAPLLIMSRKDAYRAMEDETLAKSVKDRFRGMSSQGKLEKRQTVGR